MSPLNRTHKRTPIRLFNWRCWSLNTLYGPISFVWFWLCVKARSFYFFSAGNPSIEYGGFVLESKKAIYDIMPEGLYPQTIYVPRKTIPDRILQQINKQHFIYPLIVKPDRGRGGRGVKKLYNENELVEYAYTSQVDFLVQEFINFPNEVSIFYYRYPDDRSGMISGIARKEFLTGNVISTMHTPSGCIQWIDESHLADKDISFMINRLCRQVRGFYYGRLDIRYKDWDELREGKNFSVIEINGAGAEPAHIFDPRHSIFFAWREIIRHWKILWRISTNNNRKGIPYISKQEGRVMSRENKEMKKTLAGQYV